MPEWNLGLGLTVSGRSALRVENYYIAGALVLVLLVLLRNLIHSRVGRALQAIHSRETAAGAMGINTAAYKLRAFVLSALLAAMAGVFFTHYTGGIGPSEASAFKSVRYVALAASGGMASLWGVTGMSTLLNYLSLRGLFGSYDNAVFGIILITIVSLAPEGPLKPLGLWMQTMAGKMLGTRRVAVAMEFHRIRLKHRTSNIERRTSNGWTFGCCLNIQSSMFDVRCSMLSASHLPERRPGAWRCLKSKMSGAASAASWR